MIEIEVDFIENKTETIKRWNLNNKEGWKEFNKEFPTLYDESKPNNQGEINKLITNTMEKTIGKTTIRIGNRKKKESETIKNLRKEVNKFKKAYEIALKGRQPDFREKQDI